jgi:signal transduction histidine kinase
MLDQLIATHREGILRRCRAKAAMKLGPRRDAPLDHGVSLFLDQLVDTLRVGPTSSAEICSGATLHGHRLLSQGLTLSQVVHTYGDVRQSIMDLTVETNVTISTDDFRILHRSVDEAIAGAVSGYVSERSESPVDGEAARESERAGFVAHELRNLLNTAIVAFEVLQAGSVGASGSTASVLHRSLLGLRALIGRSLAEVRVTHGMQNPERFLVAEFIDELTPSASLEANARGITLRVTPVEDGVTIEADRQVLAAVVGNVLQNAFKFTRPRTTVTLRVAASAERVLIEVQDECGGLPSGDVNELFRAFEQQSADRTGLGLGLAFCRWGVEANHGRISARTVPGSGCVFTVDLPRLPVPAVAIV